MTYDFSKPQRQSAAGIIIMAANGIVRVIRATIIPIVIFLVKSNSKMLMYTSGAAIIALVIVFIFSYLSYRKFTFFLDGDKQEFIINKGIFSKTLLTIQLDKIQQVNINQSLLQKLIGVYSLQIDTPGGDANEVSIKAIDEKVAYSLKEHLLHGSKEELTLQAEQTTEATPEKPFLKLSPNTLLKVGLTSNYSSSFALLFGFVYAIFHNAKDLLKAFDSDDGQIETAIKAGISIVSVGILVAVIICALLAINIIRTYVKYSNFEIVKHKLSLLISSGLFAKKNTLLNPAKVQITAYSQNYFQKKFNLMNLELKQINTGNALNEDRTPMAHIQVPGCDESEKDQLLTIILGRIPEQGLTFSPNFRFLNLPILFGTILPLGVFLIFWYYFDEVRPFYPLAMMYFFLSLLLTYISYRRHRLTVSRDFIIKKSGIWEVSHEIIFPHKIQAITTSQYPWHKALDIGHVSLHTAAGVIHFGFGNFTEIKKLVNYWLYQVESSSEEWM
ncbi:MAG: hypothetical protein EOO90_00335 [Pedobacter sp.]|nr:MAG: hypothetical protein EOO90_00335 [Pedobacter sp.]